MIAPWVRPLPFFLLLLLAGCGSAVMSTTPEYHDSILFTSPTQVVDFVYQNISAGRYRDIGEAFLAYTDRRPWIGWAERGEQHPWTLDSEASWRVSGLHERAPGEAMVVVEERWSGGGFHERHFLTLWTSDGWRIADVDGVPADGLSQP